MTNATADGIADLGSDQPRSGDEAVDAALADLAQLGRDAPLTQHVVVLSEVHDALQRRLSATQG